MLTSGPIIIVEDDKDDQELFEEVLSELNIPHAIRVFNSCKVAFNYLLSTLEKPFMIISDMNLPGMSGLEFLTAIQQNTILRDKSIPFLFLTTSSDPVSITQAYAMSAKGFFVKPLTLQELKDLFQMIVGYWTMTRRP
jgi:CheY-like chemotaxis protein